jgi:hypothetical protein
VSEVGQACVATRVQRFANAGNRIAALADRSCCVLRVIDR